jgi:hypothetical protein
LNGIFRLRTARCTHGYFNLLGIGLSWVYVGEGRNGLENVGALMLSSRGKVPPSGIERLPDLQAVSEVRALAGVEASEIRSPNGVTQSSTFTQERIADALTYRYTVTMAQLSENVVSL